MVQGHDLEFDDSASCVDWDMRGEYRILTLHLISRVRLKSHGALKLRLAPFQLPETPEE